MVIQKEHLTQEGLITIVNIRASINLGLSLELKQSFPNTIPVKKLLVVDQVIRDPEWLAGFTSGEGCFFVNTTKSKTYWSGYQVKLRFQLTQHCRDEGLMRSLVRYFDCGNVYFSREAVDFIVEKFSELDNKIIPFFEKYLILGVKAQDFKYFCQIAKLIKQDKHRTQSGLNQIHVDLKAGMNKGRLG